MAHKIGLYKDHPTGKWFWYNHTTGAVGDPFDSRREAEQAKGAARWRKVYRGKKRD